MLPPFLKKNDKVAIVSPSGCIDPLYIDEAVSCLQSWDLQPIVGQYAKEKNGRFAGTTVQRTADLQAALDDKEIKAILCSRGGYGVIQIIDGLDFSYFELYPKWLIGFSDITALHNVATAIDVASCHSSMVKLLAKYKEENKELQLLKDLLFGELPQYVIDMHPLNRKGKAKGILAGGNLSVLYSLRGTHYEIDTYGKILFLEDIGEKPYHIDRMMHNLKIGGLLEHLAGLVVGQFSDYEEDPLMGKSVYELIADAVSEYDYPVCFDFPAGHVDVNSPLVLGAEVSFEVSEKVILKY
jgi:muramoyltetrapeptide carboxypeptidase